MFEYKRTQFSYVLYNELIVYLNKEGNDDWEIILFNEEKKSSGFSADILFKRKKIKKDIYQ